MYFIWFSSSFTYQLTEHSIICPYDYLIPLDCFQIDFNEKTGISIKIIIDSLGIWGINTYNFSNIIIYVWKLWIKKRSNQ